MQPATSSLKPVLNIACCQGVKLDWLYIESGDCGGCAVWERSVAVNKQGVLFVAATFGGEEQEVVVLTLRKITPALVCFGHVYVPVDWLFENFPLSRRRCQPMVMEALRIVKVRVITIMHTLTIHQISRAVAVHSSPVLICERRWGVT